MSGGEILRAAGLMRDEHGPDHERHAMWSAIADWLDAQARLRATDDSYALKVARAYLEAER